MSEIRPSALVATKATKRVLCERTRFCIGITEGIHEILLVNTKIEIEYVFLFYETEKVIYEDKRPHNPKCKQETLCGYYGNQRIPDRCWKRKCPHPQRAANRMSGKRRAKRSRKQKSLAKEMRNNRNRPEQRELPDGSADGVGYKSHDGDCGNDYIEFSFLCEVERRKEHGEKTNDRSRIFNLGAVREEVHKLHQKYRYDSGDASDEGAGDRRERVIDRKRRL